MKAESLNRARLTLARRRVTQHWPGVSDAWKPLPSGTTGRVWAAERYGRRVVIKCCEGTPDQIQESLTAATTVQRFTGMRCGIAQATDSGTLSISASVHGIDHSLMVMDFVQGVGRFHSTRAAVARAGRVLGEVHSALTGEAGTGALTMDELRGHLETAAGTEGRMSGWFRRAMSALDSLEEESGLLYGDGPDFAWADDAITGLVDWQALRYGPRSFDLATWALAIPLDLREVAGPLCSAYSDTAPSDGGRAIGNLRAALEVRLGHMLWWSLKRQADELVSSSERTLAGRFVRTIEEQWSYIAAGHPL